MYVSIDNVTSKDVMSYGLLATMVVMFVTMLVGIPVASIVF